MFGSAAEAKAARDAGMDQHRSERTGMRGAGGYASPDGRLSQRADVRARNAGITDARANAAARAWADRVSDYGDTYNSRWDKIGNALAGTLGLHEIAPSFDVRNLNSDTDWGLDPAGGLAGIAGNIFGGPAGGLVAGRLANTLSEWAGRPFEINLGPHVFGGGSQGVSPMGGSAPAGATGPLAGHNAARRYGGQQGDLALGRAAYQQAQAQAMQQRQQYLRQASNSRQAQTPSGQAAQGSALAMPYSAMPGSGKASGYGGTARPEPITYSTPYL